MSAASLLAAQNIPLSQQATAADKVKNRNWQTGKLLDSQRNRFFAGTVGAGRTMPDLGDPDGPWATFRKTTIAHSVLSIETTSKPFLIEGDQYVYLAQQRFRRKPANLTVDDPVTYAVERQALFLIDEDGKER